MNRYLLGFLALCFLAACKTQKPAVDNMGRPVPRITWQKQSFNLGKVKRGETRDLVYNFTNTGSRNLVIELVTTCKCTQIDWPREPIPPGGKGQITATYDSTNQHFGELTKTIDVIANTYPIVVEAFFTVDVIQ